MRITVFNTPVISQLSMLLAKSVLLISGWKIEGSTPRMPRYILIAAPHTSNWDFFIGLAAGLCCGIECHWLGDANLFRGPLGPIMRWLGGIPVDRTNKNSLVSRSICYFRSNQDLKLVVCPEASCSRGNRWRTGFYHIAKGADIPIILGYLDFAKKEAGFGPALKTSNNMEKDLAEIQAFYDKKQGKFPRCVTPVCSQPEN